MAGWFDLIFGESPEITREEFMRQSRFSLLGVAVLIVCLLAPAAYAEFSLNGYIQMQAGVFISDYRNKTRPDRDGDTDIKYPKDHGGLYGRLSMFRNTLQLEADYSPIEQINLHVVFRGVRSAPLMADNYAQVPHMTADTTYNHDVGTMRAKRNWVNETYYSENDLREVFLDIEATDWLSFRLGRQQVSWGETGSFKTLDIVNPSNTTWHFGPFESFEDTRIPLWMAKVLIDIPPAWANLELLWIPLIDEPENTVTTPLTFVGAWGLPIAPEQEHQTDVKIQDKKMVYPNNDLTDSRLGARWKGTFFGGITYTLVYFYTHQVSPPIPTYMEKKREATPGTQFSDATVYLEFPRQHVVGGSLDYAIPRPISTVLRMEAAYYPDKWYPMNSNMEPGKTPTGGVLYGPSKYNGEGVDIDDPSYRMGAPIYHEERDVVSFAAVLMRPNQIRWLNPHSSIITQFQYMLTALPDGIDIKDANGNVRNDIYWMVNIPGYDTTEVSQYSHTLVAAALTNYFHGLFSPMLVGVVLLGEDASDPTGFLSAKFRFNVGNHWRFEVGSNLIFAANPYEGLGFFRDRDEIYGKIKFQF